MLWSISFSFSVWVELLFPVSILWFKHHDFELEVDDGWPNSSDPPDDCWTSMTEQMGHSKCNDVSVSLGVSGGHMLMYHLLQNEDVSSRIISAVGFFSLVFTSTCKEQKKCWITELCEYNWPWHNLDFLLVFSLLSPHSSSISQPSELTFTTVEIQ